MGGPLIQFKSQTKSWRVSGFDFAVLLIDALIRGSLFRHNFGTPITKIHIGVKALRPKIIIESVTFSFSK